MGIKMLRLPGAGGKNLFDKSAVIQGIIKSDGTIDTSLANWRISDYMAVEPNTDYAYTTDSYGTAGAVCTGFYDSNKSYLSVQREQALLTRTPANCKYVRVCVFNSKLDTTQFEKGSTATPYEPYVPYIYKPGVSHNFMSPNLLDPDTIVNGSGVRSDNGITSNNAGFSRTPNIEVEPNTTYVTNFCFGSNGTYGLAFYDADKEFISGITISTGYNAFTTPATAKYIKMSRQENPPTGNLYLNKGTDRTYYPYGQLIKIPYLLQGGNT